MYYEKHYTNIQNWRYKGYNVTVFSGVCNLMVLSLQGQINPPPLFIPAVTLLISLRASQPAPLKTPPQICHISLQALAKGYKLQACRQSFKSKEMEITRR